MVLWLRLPHVWRGASLETYAPGWMNAADDVCGRHKDCNTNHYRKDIDQYDACPWEIHGHAVEVIVGGIQRHKPRCLLQYQKGKGYGIAIQQSACHNHGGEVQECAAQLSVGATHGLHHTYETGTLKDDDEQSAHHGYSGNANHEDKYGGDVGVQQCKPRENLREVLIYTWRGLVLPISILAHEEHGRHLL